MKRKEVRNQVRRKQTTKEKILKKGKRYRGSVNISMPFQICVTEIPEREKKKKTVFLKNFSKISQWYKAHV